MLDLRGWALAAETPNVRQDVGGEDLARNTQPLVVLWWAGAILAYPALLAAVVLAYFNAAPQWPDPAIRLVLFLAATLLLFGAWTFVALSTGAPRRLWIVPTFALVAYAVTQYVSLSYSQGAPWILGGSLAWVIYGAILLLLLAAVVGTVLGSALFAWRRRTRRTLAEQALQPGAPKRAHNAR